MHKPRKYALFLAVVVIAVVAVPAAAFGALTNDYGMKYAGQDICLSCHDTSYGETTHGHFAQVGADPSADYMWPAGRLGVGEIVEKSQVAFTLGYGTGLREYLVNNEVVAPEPVPVVFTEVMGDSRYETAVNASKEAFDSASTVVVATGESFPDAMGGAALAGAVDGPVLLTPSSAVPASVMAEITRLGATKVYVLGGTGAVSGDAFAQLDAAFGEVVRVTGTDRYATALAVANETIDVLGAGYTGGAFMATGANFPDALGASPLMYAEGMPVILVDPTGAYSLPAEVTDVVILGGTGAVPASVQTALGATFDSRIAGDNRYETAAAVAQYGVSLGMSWDGVGIATGENFPDALCAGPLVGSNNAVMLLTTSASLSTDAASKLTANKASIANATFIGGTGAVSAFSRNQVKAILTGVTPPASQDTNPFVVPSLEWDPIAPDTWEIGEAGIEMETYSCNPCHHLGAVNQGKKPTVGNFVSTSVTASVNAWVTDPTGPTSSPAKYVAGSSIQCEVCHGTGTPTGTAGNHFSNFTSNVKILKGTELLDSQVCGQCHGSYKSKSMYGYTPDQNIMNFVTPRTFADVPTEASFTANPSAYKFFPNGQNKGDKHSYYTEWTMSGHSWRGALTPASPRASVYQKTGAGHYNATTSSLDCAKCHTGEGYAVRKGLAIVDGFVPSNSNTGFMGQECAVCHIPHGADSENGMAVRAPDATPSLLGVTMTSICEDCHNYQLEMQNLPFPAFPSNPATISLTARAGDFFSHPTREIYSGVGMYDVEDAGKFMPGVKCEECHMPATKSDFPSKTGLERYANQSWKRYSHRMFIMEPGKAADWGLAPWGDSCSPCHAGQSQDELQDNIEKWQQNAAVAAAATQAAYEAAWAIKDDTAGSADMRLLARARVNYKNYTGEGSMGAHNPEYIVAGLEAATKMAKSVQGEFGFVSGGTATGDLDYVIGQVLNGDGSGAAGAKIVYTINGTDEYTAMADANGNFSFLFSYLDDVTSIKWVRSADPATELEYLVP
ncbi:MAG: ammonia-forming cytochrome c nitrite reductase subunit c552 [Coriobacteriia bacterium]